MSKLTITEALAEIKTVTKRIENKRQFVNSSFAMDSRLRDPYEESGGVKKKLREELQAIGDLEQRLVDLRMAIARANSTTQLTIGKRSRTVSEWLIWRREVAPATTRFYKGLQAGIANAVKHKFDPNENASVVVVADQAHITETIEDIDAILGELDGKLSLLNATTFVEL